MKLKELYSFFVEQGISKDPRGVDSVKNSLKAEKNKFEKLQDEEKVFFDKESLSNPYLDSRILNDTNESKIESILVGIDIETPELLLAQTLRSQGKKINLVLTHHPEGRAYATFYEVMGMQADILQKFGVPINIAESLTDIRKREVGRKVKPQNHHRSVDSAKLLNMSFMSAHTVADNHVADYLQNLLVEKSPNKLGDIIDILRGLPEYKEAAENGAGPFILNGNKESRTGKIFVDMTGGTEGHKEALEKLANSGVGTIVGMHMSEDHYKNAQKHHINIVIAGHISSDNLGLNLLLDSAEKKFGKLEIIECSGFRRFKRS